MYWDVVEVKPETDHCLFVRFKDGLSGRVRLRREEMTDRRARAAAGCGFLPASLYRLRSCGMARRDRSGARRDVRSYFQPGSRPRANRFREP